METTDLETLFVDFIDKHADHVKALTRLNGMTTAEKASLLVAFGQHIDGQLQSAYLAEDKELILRLAVLQMNIGLATDALKPLTGKPETRAADNASRRTGYDYEGAILARQEHLPATA